MSRDHDHGEPERTDPKHIEAVADALQARGASQFAETIKSAVLSATFTVCGALAVWVWQIDRTVTVAVEGSKQFVTQREMVEFVTAQRAINDKVTFLYNYIVESKLHGGSP